MLCISPASFNKGQNKAACGQCVNCRINHKLRWMGRMALERKYAHGTPGSFITLTYHDDYLPSGGKLKREDLTEFMRELKRRNGGYARYFAVGEYGSQNLRPHFHVIHFDGHGGESWTNLYDDIWKKGWIKVGTATDAVFNYVAAYVTKKLDQKHEAAIEQAGLVPEFFSCSLKPTLGYTGLKAIADMLTTSQGAAAIVKHGFPRGFHINGRYFPFFRRDRLKVLQFAGYGEKDRVTEEHLERIDIRNQFYLEEHEVYVKAHRLSWDSVKIHAELAKLREEQIAEATEKEIELARARARKWRRLQANKKGDRKLD